MKRPSLFLSLLSLAICIAIGLVLFLQNDTKKNEDFSFLYPHLSFGLTDPQLRKQQNIAQEDVLIDEEGKLYVQMEHTRFPHIAVYHFEKDVLKEYGYLIDESSLKQNSAKDFLALFEDIIQALEAHTQSKAARLTSWRGKERPLSEVEAGLQAAEVDCNAEIKTPNYTCNIWLSNDEGGIALLVIYSKPQETKEK